MKLTDLLEAIAIWNEIKGHAKAARPGDAAPIVWPFRALGRKFQLRGIVEVIE